MYKSDPFYRRIMTRLSEKPLTKEVKRKLKLSAIDDVVDAQVEGSVFLDEKLDPFTFDDLEARYDEFIAEYDDLSGRANVLAMEMEDYDAASSEINSILSTCINAKETYESLAEELGLNPSDNSEWVELTNVIDELEALQDRVMNFSPDMDKLYNL